MTTKVGVMKLDKKQQAMLKSYLRSALAAVVAVMATIDFTWRDVLKAFVAALIPPVIRWLDPKDKAFGRTTPSR
jgi:predicted histidine transporter YuiF (NhaC family)